MARDERQDRWPVAPIQRDCAITRQTISADLDGEANEFEQAAARRHRSICPDCDRLAEQVTRATANVRTAPMLEAGRRLVPVARRRSIRLPLAVAGSVAAIAMAAVLGFAVSASVNTPQKPAAKPELRLANADTRRAQADLQRLRMQQLLHLSKNDPLLDRNPRRLQLLG
jgi:hypothetical protein